MTELIKVQKTQVIFSLWMPSAKNMIKACLILSAFVLGLNSFSSDKVLNFTSEIRCTSETKLLISLSYIFEQAARQSQITPDSYHDKHRDHPDDGKSGLGKKLCIIINSLIQ